MAHCPRIDNCAFLKDEMYQQMTRLLERFQELYCQDQFTSCACYKIASALDESFIPPVMLPSQVEWADQIIRENKPLLQTH